MPTDTVPGRDYPIILFDGLCHLCDRSVQFILKRERRQRLHFAPLASALGRELLQRYGLAADALETMVLVEKERTHTRSSAVLRVAAHLRFPWNAGILFLVVPKPLRDAVYNLVARNRYRWFGKRSSCRVPAAEWRERFHD